MKLAGLALLGVMVSFGVSAADEAVIEDPNNNLTSDIEVVCNDFDSFIKEYPTWNKVGVYPYGALNKKVVVAAYEIKDKKDKFKLHAAEQDCSYFLRVQFNLNEKKAAEEKAEKEKAATEK